MGAYHVNIANCMAKKIGIATNAQRESKPHHSIEKII